MHLDYKCSLVHQHMLQQVAGLLVAKPVCVPVQGQHVEQLPRQAVGIHIEACDQLKDHVNRFALLALAQSG